MYLLIYLYEISKGNSHYELGHKNLQMHIGAYQSIHNISMPKKPNLNIFPVAFVIFRFTEVF